MMRALAAIALLLVAAMPAGAQQDATGLTLRQLRTPAAPALILLGVAPSVVERPTAPSAFAVSLFAASGAEDLLPRDYALELAPYWLAPHPGLTFESYYAPGFLRGMLQTTSLSLATVPLSQMGDTAATGTAVGLGLRTLLLAGRAHPTLTQTVRGLQAIQAAANRVTLDREEATDDATRERLERQLDTLDARAGEAALEIQRLDTERVGWIIEAAGAMTLDFPGNRTDSGSVGLAGGWLTVMYRMPRPALDLVAVARYQHERATARDLIGLGGRLAWRIDDLVVSGELLGRFGDGWATGERPGCRLTGNLEYRLPAVGYLTAAIGTDTDGPGSRLIATFGIDLGFGTIPLRIP